MDEELNDYEQWLVGLPKRWEAQLQTSDHAKTAFWKARKNGWDVDDLIVDSMSVASRNLEGIGIVITRLRTLSEVKPIKRGQAQGMPKDLSPELYEEWEAAADPEGDRTTLLAKIRSEHVGPDEAETLMADLNALLRHRHGVVSGFRQRARYETALARNPRLPE